MRDEFAAIISGWTLVDGFDFISKKLEEVSIWADQNKPLQPDEEKTIELMIQCQIARGIEEFGFPL